MNFDERMDQLTRRHETLAKGVELLLRAQDRRDKNLGRMELLQAKNETLMAQVMESISSLARIAHAHESRISGLEAT
jgi:hypothetical protein